MKKFIGLFLLASLVLTGCELGGMDFSFPSLDEEQQEDSQPQAADPAGAQEESSSGDEADAEEPSDRDVASEEDSDTVTIATSDGCVITFFGPFEARRGDPFVVEFRVVCDSNPGQGTFYATLGNPPSDANATHINGELGADGYITLTLEVNWETGTTTLLCSYNGEVYEVTEIAILEAG